MLVEIQIIELVNPKKILVAYNNSVKPEIGDITIGINSICSVEYISDNIDHKIYKLSDGSSVTNPIKVIGEISEFNIDSFYEKCNLYISCEGTQKNPILKKNGIQIDVIRFT